MSEITAPVENVTEISAADKAMFEGLRPFFDSLKTITTSANEKATKIRTATSGREDALATVLNTSDDEKIVAFRANYEKGEAAKKKIEDQLAELKAAAAKHAESLLPGVQDGFKVEEERAEFMGLRKDATAMGQAVLVMLSGDEAKKKAAYDYFGVTEVVSLGRNGSTTGAGSKKPRISKAVIDGKDFTDAKGNVTFTALAAHIGAEVNDLRTAYFKAAGTEDSEALKGKEVSFPFNVKDKTLSLVLTGSEGNQVKKTEAPTETVSEDVPAAE